MVSCRYLPNKPEVMLRNDDLLILVATIALVATSLCCSEWELLPFVRHIEARMVSTMQLIWFLR